MTDVTSFCAQTRSSHWFIRDNPFVSEASLPHQRRSEMSGPSAYLGSRISLISKAQIRYEGVLHAINADQQTVTLSQGNKASTSNRFNIRCFPHCSQIVRHGKSRRRTSNRSARRNIRLHRLPRNRHQRPHRMRAAARSRTRKSAPRSSDRIRK